MSVFLNENQGRGTAIRKSYGDWQQFCIAMPGYRISTSIKSTALETQLMPPLPLNLLVPETLGNGLFSPKVASGNVLRLGPFWVSE